MNSIIIVDLSDMPSPSKECTARKFSPWNLSYDKSIANKKKQSWLHEGDFDVI